MKTCFEMMKENFDLILDILPLIFIAKILIIFLIVLSFSWNQYASEIEIPDMLCLAYNISAQNHVLITTI